MKAENQFTQLCVWPACIVGDKDKQAEFVKFMKDEFNSEVLYAEETVTNSGDGGEGGRNDVLFYVSTEDIPKFAAKRLAYGIRWWEDVKGESYYIYPSEIRNKYPKTW